MELRPEEQRVIHGEHQDAGVSQQFEIGPARWQQWHPANGDRQEDEHRDDESKGHERDRRQIAQADLDREPGRAPDDAERHERRDDREFSLFRHRLAAHQVIRVATAFAPETFLLLMILILLLILQERS